MELASVISYIAKQQGIAKIDFDRDVTLYDDGDGAYIKKWNLSIPLPSKGDLEEANASFLIEKAKLAYIDLRRAEYPSMGDQLDLMYWDKVNSTTIWVDTISAIKNKYPKN